MSIRFAAQISSRDGKYFTFLSLLVVLGNDVSSSFLRNSSSSLDSGLEMFRTIVAEPVDPFPRHQFLSCSELFHASAITSDSLNLYCTRKHD